MGFNPFRVAIGIGTGGLSELAGEDAMSNVPLLGTLGGYESDERKALIAKQKQMAEEARKQAASRHQARMNSLGQQMLAFNPQNQMMARMYGPEAAFSPQQLATMAADPNKPKLELSGSDYRGRAPRSDAEKKEEASRKALAAYEQEEQRRRQMIEGGLSPLPAGPAPLQQRAPAAARRY